MKIKNIFLIALVLSVLLLGFVSAETFYIDNSFKVGWTDGTDNYEAVYKVWKIDATIGGNTVTLLLMPTGIIGISNKKQGDTYILGANAKIYFDQVYVSGNDKWISITLENAQFITDAPSTPSSSGGGGGSDSSCPQYFICPDGAQVPYCSVVSFNNPGNCVNSTNPNNTYGAGPVCTGGSGGLTCQCNPNPSSLCLPAENQNNSGQGNNQDQITVTDNENMSNNSSITNTTNLDRDQENISIFKKIINWIKWLFS